LYVRVLRQYKLIGNVYNARVLAHGVDLVSLTDPTLLLFGSTARRLRVSLFQATIVARNLIPNFRQTILPILMANPRQSKPILILHRRHFVEVPAESVTNPRQSKPILILDRRHFSDKSDSEFDFDNYATVPASGGRWQLPVKDFWLPQAQQNADFRVPPKTPELSLSLTQNEIYAKYPLASTPSLPFGRIKILRSALFYQTSAQLKRLENRPNTFVRQDYVDFSCVSDSNRPISVIPKSYKIDTQTIQVQVSSYLIPSHVSLQFLVSNQAARRNLVRSVRPVTVDLGWLRTVCRPDGLKVLEEIVLGTPVMRVGNEDAGSGDGLLLSFAGRSERVKGFSSMP
jgi:hypothetical protein